MQNKPNILFIMCDQLRAPQWFGDDVDRQAMPNVAKLRDSGVNFTNACTAATCCVPSRASLLTGLYPHQHGTMLTHPPYMLDTGFKTWGGALRDLGYRTNWYGKFHIYPNDSIVEPYGFSGGVDVNEIQGKLLGVDRDPKSLRDFSAWFESSADKGPWATAVSINNPHDLCDAYRGRLPMPSVPDLDIRPLISDLPPNVETATMLKSKPRVQQALHAWAKYVLQIECADEEWRDLWIENANVYLAFERLADIEIGRVLAKLEERPEIASNTIVIFTADHGDYCGSHGLLGKGWGAYEESIRVPFIVRDPTGNWAKQTAVDRPQLTSLVDLYGLMLTLASGGNSWRGDPAYAHLADRLDVGAILQNPDAPGRDYVLHTCDEKLFPVLEGMPAEIPDHVTCIRTADAKLGVYSHWLPESIEVAPHGQDFELYDYATQAGRLELSNEFRTKPALFNSLHARLVNDAVPNELRRPLPSHLMDAYERGIAFDREGRAGRATEAFGTPLTLHSK